MANIQARSALHQKKASEAQKSAIDALQKFYGLIVGIAFTGGVLKFLENFSFSNWTSDQLGKVFLFLAFVSTIVPFYHGMERHLFETHIARNDIDWGRNGRPSNILVDIFSFMIMGALLLTMGRRIDAPLVFFLTWSALLFVDIVWSLNVWKYQKGRKPIWAWNNFVWLSIAWAFFFLVPSLFDFFTWNPNWISVSQTGAVAASEILRSIFDYKKYWEFYFPDEQAEVQNLIYLAGPYSNDAPKNPDEPANQAKRLARFNAITEVARQLIEARNLVYSPLTMTHPIDNRMDHDPGSDYWVSFDEAFMRHCTEIYVFKLPGWEHSSGIKREIDSFEKRGIKPTYLDPADFNVMPDNTDFKAAFE